MTTGETSRGQIKGVVFRTFVSWYVAKRGQRALEAAMQRLPIHVRAAFDPTRPALGILPWRWYPSEYVHELIEAVDHGLSASTREAWMRDANRHAVDVLIAGPFRWLLATVATPQMYGRHVQSIWDMLHDTGTRRITFASAFEAECVVTNWAGHHPVLCEIVHTTTAAVFEATGCRGMKLERVACIARGDADCRSRLTWEGY